MLADLSTYGMLLALGMIVPVAAFAGGCAVGLWFFRSSRATATTDASRSPDSEFTRLAERAMMASERVKDLAQHAASQVGEHNSKVEAFNSDLRAYIEQPAEFSTDTLLFAIGQMTCANAELKQRLHRIERQLEAQSDELRSYSSEARTDSLTGLANRRAFDDDIKRRFAEWQRRRVPFTLMILDADNFKLINDSLGHLAGDEALRQVGKVIAENSRQMDFRCRYGGDEFVVVMPNTSLQEARVAAERLRSAIESAVIKMGTVTFSLTCSFGVARIDVHDNDVSNVIRRADESLYKSKESGRNCGYWHDGRGCLPLGAGPSAAERPEEPQANELLTGRSEFLEVLSKRVVESERFGVPLSVIHLSVDDIQALCQENREAADTVLEAVAVFTQAVLRPCDRWTQLADGEFAILLPGSTRNEASQIVRRLHLAAANCNVQLQYERVQLSLSHGIAEYGARDTAESLLDRARTAANSEPVADSPAVS